MLVKTLYLNTSNSVNRSEALVLWYAAQLTQVLAAVLGRASIAMLALRIIGFKSPYGSLIIFCLASTLFTGTIFTSTTFAQCDVTHAFWHDSSSSCMSVRAWGIVGIIVFGSFPF